MRSRSLLAAAALTLGLGATAFVGAFEVPFIFLEGPKGRENKFDPKSPNFVPTSTTIPTASGPVGSATSTRTATPTPTSSITASPVNSATPSNTPIPTQTPNWDGDDPTDNTSAGPNMPPAITTANQMTTARDAGEPGDPADYFQLTLASGSQYTFSLTILSGAGTATVELRDSLDALVTGPSAAISSYALGGPSGTYYVVVRSTGYVSYQLNYQDVTGSTPTFTSTVTPPNSFTSTPTISPTSTDTPMAPPTFTNTATPSATPTSTNVVAPTSTSTPFPAAVLMLYDDMENAACYTYTYNDGSVTLAAPIQDTGTFKNGAASIYHVYDQGTVWGAGWGWGAAGCPVVDARPISATMTYYWIKTDQDTNVFLTWVEDNATLGVANSEHWTSPQVFVGASPSWQLIEIPMASYIPNDYFHNVLANPMDNSIFDPVVNSADMQYGAKLPANTAPANIYFDDVGFSDISQGPPPPPTPTPVPGGVGYSNLESPVMNAYSYNDGGTVPGPSSIGYAQTTADANSGAQSYRFTVTTLVNDAWGGCGAGFNRPGGAVADATGMTKLRFYYKTDQAATLIMALTEMNVPIPPNNDQNEQWVSTSQSLATVGAWTMIEVPLADFATESIFNAQCQPNCTTTGDGVFNVNTIFGIDFQFTNTPALTGAQIFIDDLTFVP